MKHTYSLIILAFFLIVPNALLSARVSVILSTGFQTYYSVKSQVDNPRPEYILAPGTSIGEFPDHNNDNWLNLDVVSSRACHFTAGIEWDANLSKNLSLSFSTGLEFEDQDMTLYTEAWTYYNDYNPFYPDSPLQSNGKSNIELASDAWTPQLQASLKWKVTDKISMNINAGWGYSFESYDDFDFFTPTHQVVVGVDEIESITSENSYETQRWQLGTSIDYVISNKWTASVGYQFIFLEDLSLKNTVLDKQGNRLIHSLPLENRKAQRVTFSAACRF